MFAVSRLDLIGNLATEVYRHIVDKYSERFSEVLDTFVR